MPSRVRPAMYNTPTIRNGGFGALQVEAIHNRPLSIARRHMAASQLRMRAIEPDELSSSEWVRFLVMDTQERERWMTEFTRRRRDSNGSSSSADTDGDMEPESEGASEKAKEARAEADEAAREAIRIQAQAELRAQLHTAASSSVRPTPSTGRTPSVSIWARQFDSPEDGTEYSARRPRHARRAVTDGLIEAPPTYETVLRSRTPPPAYVPRNDGERPTP